MPLRAYEAVLVLSPNLDEDAILAFLERVREALEQKGGVVASVERWGKRRLAYDIRDFKEASYVLLRFQANPVGGTDELQHICRISEDVLRHLIVLEEEGVPAGGRPDEPAAAPTATPAPAAVLKAEPAAATATAAPVAVLEPEPAPAPPVADELKQP